MLLDDGTFEDVEAQFMMHVYEPENASAVRAGPIGQHSFNHILDEMELLALEKHAVKDGSDIARVIQRGTGATDGTSNLTELVSPAQLTPPQAA